jgi:hypothetical protein
MACKLNKIACTGHPKANCQFMVCGENETARVYDTIHVYEDGSAVRCCGGDVSTKPDRTCFL